MVRPYSALATLSALYTLTQSQQTITVTTRVCSTSPTLSQRTTTVQSIIPVYPVEWNDQIINGGAPFVIRIELRDASGYVQNPYADPSWLLPNGNTTTRPGLAGQYQLRNGQLISLDGQYASAEVGQSVEPFAVSSIISAISRTFIVQNGTLSWRNGNFTDGVAQFYKLPPNLLENARILAKLVGPMEPERSWSSVRLAPEPVPSGAQPTGGLSGYPYQSTRASASTGGTNPPAASYTGPPYQPGESAPVSTPPDYTGSSYQPGPSSSAGSPTSSASPLPSNTTPDGSCGPDNGYTCIGAYSGSCCSVYGFCGASADYCGAGCQAGYGICDRNPGQQSLSSSRPASSLPGYGSSAGAPSSSVPAPSLSGYPDGSVPTTAYTAPSSTPNPNQHESAPTISPTISASLSAYPPGQSVVDTPATCPDRSGSVVRDSNGIEYRLGCSYDASPISYVAIESPGDFNYCFELCDNSAGCAGFTYSGRPNGQGPGTCYLKGGPMQFQPGNPNLISAIRITPGTGTVTRSMEMTMSMSSGQAQPSTWSYISSGPISYPGEQPSPSSSSSSSTVNLPGYPGEPSSSVVASTTSSINLPDYGGLTSSSSRSAAATSSSVSLPGYPDGSSPSSSSAAPTTTSSSTVNLPGYEESTPILSTSTVDLPAYPDETTTTSSSASSSSLIGYVPPSTTAVPGTTTSSAPTTTIQPGTPISTDPAKCPNIDGDVVLDAQGYQYNVTCQGDSDGGSYRTYPASGGGLQTCLAQCSNDDSCGGTTYFSDETQDSGNCYLKTNVGNIYRSNSPYIQVAVRIPGGPVTRTTTTTTSSSTPPAAYTGVPTPTPCPIVQNYGSIDDTDDGFCEITLPFDMTIYEATTNQIFPNSNGVLSLLEGTTAYDVLPLPDTELPGTSLLPFFDDLYIYASRTSDTTSENPDASTGLTQGIYYTLSPSIAPTTANVTWILSRGGSYELYIFSAIYSTLQPGVVTFEYRVTGGRGSGTTSGGGTGDESSNDGATAGIGVQGLRDDGGYDHVQWAYQEAGSVTPGFSVTCDTTVSPGRCTGSDGTVVEGATTVDGYQG
ncbi:Hypothetical protein D9617_1g081270 [Elsinoe fawcettii]|nr:Hypothetical protein D9617_1g081270 [Elsinoe fawcettii]